ncbi:MAG: hypothetical protein O4861_07825 [Trichodesmium sp. St16_bin4-tuft]|nr:hypothetical protein [Trichodesmium sp. St4_bin8_1]MDE5074231.1 hypothetical protein [Trichodesmium sp. St5_bin8]MDE5079140.1 hypothetical protein [Trichodesmium sp. St2_bin6]MDE5092669.1 hypothetical protein [Trichodesmium sp. St18_bin3_1_1]MDE5098245.1 hypothetical protein [Trichodesmium sp. St16_bin4-tuft]MDE5103489.1 hypothetical protein [Trichodesmium sp. St19_bin2]
MLSKFSDFLVWDGSIRTHSLSVKLLEYGIYLTLVYDNWRSLLNYLLK